MFAADPPDAEVKRAASSVSGARWVGIKIHAGTPEHHEAVHSQALEHGLDARRQPDVVLLCHGALLLILTGQSSYCLLPLQALAKNWMGCVSEVGIGLVGGGYMGKAHAVAM